MDELCKILPKDLVFIIEDYDHSKLYNKVVLEFQHKVCRCLLENCDWKDMGRKNGYCFLIETHALDHAMSDKHLWFRFIYFIKRIKIVFT